MLLNSALLNGLLKLLYTWRKITQKNRVGKADNLLFTA